MKIRKINIFSAVSLCPLVFVPLVSMLTNSFKLHTTTDPSYIHISLPFLKCYLKYRQICSSMFFFLLSRNMKDFFTHAFW